MSAAGFNPYRDPRRQSVDATQSNDSPAEVLSAPPGIFSTAAYDAALTIRSERRRRDRWLALLAALALVATAIGWWLDARQGPRETPETLRYMGDR